MAFVFGEMNATTKYLVNKIVLIILWILLLKSNFKRLSAFGFRQIMFPHINVSLRKNEEKKPQKAS